jgi:hypothetical protein
MLVEGSVARFCGRRCRSVCWRFSGATAVRGSLRTLPGAVPVLEVKARSRTTLHGARGWLLQRLRCGSAAHTGGDAQCDLNSRAKRKRREGGLRLGVAAIGDKDRAAYMADDRNGVWDIGSWPSSWCTRVRPVAGRRLSGA